MPALSSRRPQRCASALRTIWYHSERKSRSWATSSVGRALRSQCRGRGFEPFKALPEIWQLIHPRRGLLALGFGLMVINRVSGLVLPASTKYLVDDIIGKRHYQLLYPLVGLVLTATILQGLTSFALTQTLSKAAQRLITELRRRVQEHIGRLSVSYYDSNKTGTMVSRIMSDVEGVRNLVGTGLVDFVGGLLTAVIAF